LSIYFFREQRKESGDNPENLNDGKKNMEDRPSILY
jgi:hypothetical protein